MTKKAIGVFDSGLGGLTILDALRRTLPHEDLIYFGDTANVPYGSKSKEAVTRLSLAIGRFLQEQNVKLIVAACNTASAQALGELKKQLSVPVMGVIEPGAAKAVSVTRNGHIAVLGTEGTVKSKAYPKAILKKKPNAHIIQQACPLFVPLVEENWTNKPAAQLIAREYLAPVQQSGADTIILGKKVTLVDSADTLAEAARVFLDKHHLAETKGKGRVTVYASDAPQRFKKLAQTLLADKISTVHLKKLL